MVKKIILEAREMKRCAYVNAVLPLLNWEVFSLRYAIVFAGQPPFPNP